MVIIFLLLLTIILVAICGVLSLRRYKAIWKEKGLISHAEPGPYFGNFFSLSFKLTSMPTFITEIYNLFPKAKYTGILQGDIPIIILQDPELIKDITIKNFDSFTDHDSFLTEDAEPLFAKSLFFQTGDRWRDMRNTLSPSFTGSKMKIMFDLITKCSENYVQYFVNNPEKVISVEMKDAFTRYTNDVIATTAFGITVDSMKNRNNEFYLQGKDVSDFNSIPRFIKILALYYCQPIMKLFGKSFISRSANQFFRRIVKETIKVREENNIIRPDMIHLLLEASRDEKGVKVTIDDIVAQAFIFFLAGFGTSATVMGFVGHELAVNPEIQEKLRNEVDHFTKQEGGKISYDTLSKMKYLDMVISETLRKYPPNAIIDRKCVKEYTLPKATPDSKEYTIHPKSLIWLPIYALHHDEKYFKNPDKFDPERFNDDNKDNIDPYVYIPFGLGPRKCIGNRFALMEIKILIVHLLQNFILEREERTMHPIVFENAFVVAAKGDLWVKFKKKESKN